MTTNITTAARRIARKHNAQLAGGFGGNGKLAFGTDGSGGAWYSDNTYGLGDVVVVPMRWDRMTAEQAQEILNNIEEAKAE